MGDMSQPPLPPPTLPAPPQASPTFVQIPCVCVVISSCRLRELFGISSVQMGNEELVGAESLNLWFRSYSVGTKRQLVRKYSRKLPINIYCLSRLGRKDRLGRLPMRVALKYQYANFYVPDPDGLQAELREREEPEDVEVDLYFPSCPDKRVSIIYGEYDSLPGYAQNLIAAQVDYASIQKENSYTDAKVMSMREADLQYACQTMQASLARAKEQFRAWKAETQAKLDAMSDEEKECIRTLQVIKYYPTLHHPLGVTRNNFVNRYLHRADIVKGGAEIPAV